MAETVLQRIQRIVTGRVEDRVDRLEVSGGPSGMREAIREVDRAIDEVRGQRESAMEARLQPFEQSQREAAVGGDGSMTVQRELDKKVERAEAAFDRAMTGAGGVAFTRADADTINRVAKIDGLRKGSAVADRLAALKAGKAPEDAAGQAA